MHESFSQGEFVVRWTQRNVSATPVDQAFESNRTSQLKVHLGLLESRVEKQQSAIRT